MPTNGREEFVFQAIKYFQRQDYPNRELIIIDDAIQDLSLELPRDEKVRYVLEPPGLTIGVKRNHGCELARGKIIVHWDDDDWYGPERLRLQVGPLIEGSADVTAFDECTFFDVTTWTFWRCKRSLFSRMYVGAAHAGTLAYVHSLFERGIRYPPVSLGEDAAFLYQCFQEGSRICRMSGDGAFLYVRHSSSTWGFTCGEFIDSSSWVRAPEPAMPIDDRQFYKRYADQQAIKSIDKVSDSTSAH